MIKAIIFQLLKKYKSQNSDYKNYLKFSVLLYRRHRMRSHQTPNLRKYFLSAHKKLNKQRTQLEKKQILTSPDNNSRQSFLHFKYNASDVTGRAAMQLHTKHCQAFQGKLDLLPPKICYSRPKNIGDLATQTRLHQHPERPSSYFMGEYQRGLDPSKDFSNFFCKIPRSRLRLCLRLLPWILKETLINFLPTIGNIFKKSDQNENIPIFVLDQNLKISLF